jgi:hypothetical protein
MDYFFRLVKIVSISSILFIIFCHLYNYYILNFYGDEEIIFAKAKGTAYNSLHFKGLLQYVIIPSGLVSSIFFILSNNFTSKNEFLISVALGTSFLALSINHFVQQLIVFTIIFVYFLTVAIISKTQNNLNLRLNKKSNLYQSQDSKNQFA